MAKKYDKEPKDWITINGNHIPVFEGETNEQAAARFIEEKRSLKVGNKEVAIKQDRLTSEDDPKKLREEIKERLLDKDSYIYSDEYKELENKVTKANKEKEEIDKQIKDLEKTIEEDTYIDEEEMKRYPGDKNIAKMLATKQGPKAKAAEEELKELKESKSIYDDEVTFAQNRLKKYEDSFIDKQKEQLKEEFRQGKETLTPDIKDEYEGFELDTHVSDYQKKLERGQAVIMQMSPKEYLRRCGSDIFDSTYERQVRTIMADAEHTYKLADMMRDGTKMYMPYISYEDKQQEGRHRAAAAILNGIEVIPVLVEPKRRRY